MQVYPDSATLQVDSAKSSPHALPFLHLYAPIATIDRKNFLVSTHLDLFWDSIGSLEIEHDFWGIYLPQMRSDLSRKRSQAGLNIILLRREKLKEEKFYLHKYHSKITAMEYYTLPVRVQHAWSARLGALQLRNPMVNIKYKFNNAGQGGIPQTTQYIDSSAAPVNFFYLGIGRVRKRILSAKLQTENCIQPHISRYTFYYLDFFMAQKPPSVVSVLPYTEDPQDKPVLAGVSPTDKLPRAGMRLGLYGLVAKSNYPPVFYAAEFGTYPGYALGTGYYIRVSLGLRLLKWGR